MRIKIEKPSAETIAKMKKLPKLPDLVERDQRAFDWEYDATDRNTAAWPAELPPPAFGSGRRWRR
jgi:hypothetical protein